MEDRRKEFVDAMEYNLFADDYLDGEDRKLSDKLVIAKKDHEKACVECGGDCKNGTVNRVMNWIMASSFRTYRTCEDCLRKHVEFIKSLPSFMTEEEYRNHYMTDEELEGKS